MGRHDTDRVGDEVPESSRRVEEEDDQGQPGGSSFTGQTQLRRVGDDDVGTDVLVGEDGAEFGGQGGEAGKKLAAGLQRRKHRKLRPRRSPHKNIMISSQT